ncbi:MAG: helix-hairpin-helix domain-containing protein [Planctomycetales bacterium]
MITKITGTLAQVGETSISLAVGPMEHEVLTPEFVRRQLQAKVGEEVVFFTIEYLEGNPMQGRLTPRLIGFLAEAERQFFDLICSVDGIGVKKALRAMVRPVREVAEAIERQDHKALSALPGIGAAASERIVAKLRRKVPQFALMVSRDESGDGDASRDVVEEAFEVLQAVGHSSPEARRMIETTLEGTKKKFKDVQDLLGAVYEKQQPS